MENEPRKLQILKDSTAIMSTELLGVVEEDGSFSYAYKFTTDRDATYYALRWYAFYAEAVKPSESWLAKNDASKWEGSRDFDKAWQQMIKEELTRVRKDLLKDTLKYFRAAAQGDAKEGLKNLLLEDYDSDSDINNAIGEFKKNKAAEKAWKAIKL